MKYVLLLTVSTFLVICGCTKIPYLVLFNNSGRALTINSEGTIYSVSPGTVMEIEYPGNTELLKIGSASSTAWEYKVMYPDKAHMNGNKFCVQIESNGLIYVLPPSAKDSLKELPVQPDGFPWRPINVAEKRVNP